MCGWLLSLQLAFTAAHLDVWFESDSAYVLSQISDRLSEHNDTNSRHPLYPLITFGAAWTLDRTLGIERRATAEMLLLVGDAVFMACAYLALRLLGRPRPVALLFVGVIVVTTPGLLFLGIHERMIPGGISVLLVVIAAAAYRRGVASRRWLLGAAVSSLGITITNFMTGAALLVASAGIRRGLRMAAVAYGIVQVLSVVTLLMFPSSTLFSNIYTWPWMNSVRSYLPDVVYRAGTPVQKSTAFWAHAIVMPEPARQLKRIAEPPMSYVSFQHVGLDRHGWRGFAALGLWLTCLAAGAISTIRVRDPVSMALVAALAAQWGLFLLFGEETVLYAPYFVPLAALIASRAVAERWADFRVRAAAGVFFVLLAWNNLEMFFQARTLALALL